MKKRLPREIKRKQKRLAVKYATRMEAIRMRRKIRAAFRTQFRNKGLVL